MNTEILSVGTELLLGTATNTDARDISLALAEIGINVYWHTVVGDNPARLTECIYRARNRADLIITTGGLGPTCDDLTKQTVARAFGRELCFDQAAADAMREYFAQRGSDFTQNNMRQAWLPENCTVLPNAWGTAPGCIFQEGEVYVVMLPGPPRECMPMLREHVLPWLRKFSHDTILSHTVRMFGIGEGAMETRLRDLMDGANPTVAPYAKTGECLVRVTAKGETPAKCEELMTGVLGEIRRRMGDLIYGVDCPGLEYKALELLAARGKTLATAESCTGGLVAQRLTAIPGASVCYKGGVNVYTEEAKCTLLGLKQKMIDCNGVVSAPVAMKMAKRVRKTLHSDLGIGVTGWAGPDGDDVGLVYVALAAKGECFVRRLQMGRTADRERIRTVAAHNAFDMIRRFLTGLDV